MTRPAFHSIALAAAALLLAAAAVAQSADRSHDFVFSAYKDMTLRSPDRIGRIADPAETAPAANRFDGIRALTWASAAGECGSETWGEVEAQRVAEANMADLARAGIGYILSVGGPAGVFTCASDAGFERFLIRYTSPTLLGVDFDIDVRSSSQQIRQLVQRMQAAQRRHPQLRFSITLATRAASDGSRASLDATGQEVLRAAREAGWADFFVNLKVMNYGAADPALCVVVDGRCDMAASAMQAARNVEAAHRVPLARIELTPMIGRNEVAANIFTPEDALRLGRFAREQGLGGLHYRSLDRDAPCIGPAEAAAKDCHGLAGVPPGHFGRALNPMQPP